MRDLLINLTASLFTVAAALISPVLIALSAHALHPDLGLAGLGVGMVAGPWFVFWASDLIMEATT